jgi:hypothetical protein
MKQWIWKCPHFFTIGWVRGGGALLLSINTGQKEARKANDLREYPLMVVLSTQNGVLQKAQINKISDAPLRHVWAFEKFEWWAVPTLPSERVSPAGMKP